MAEAPSGAGLLAAVGTGILKMRYEQDQYAERSRYAERVLVAGEEIRTRHAGSELGIGARRDGTRPGCALAKAARCTETSPACRATMSELAEHSRLLTLLYAASLSGVTPGVTASSRQLLTRSSAPRAQQKAQRFSGGKAGFTASRILLRTAEFQSRISVPIYLPRMKLSTVPRTPPKAPNTRPLNGARKKITPVIDGSTVTVKTQAGHSE